jgi:hypothetical protein
LNELLAIISRKEQKRRQKPENNRQKLVPVGAAISRKLARVVYAITLGPS